MCRVFPVLLIAGVVALVLLYLHDRGYVVPTFYSKSFPPGTKTGHIDPDKPLFKHKIFHANLFPTRKRSTDLTVVDNAFLKIIKKANFDAVMTKVIFFPDKPDASNQDSVLALFGQNAKQENLSTILYVAYPFVGIDPELYLEKALNKTRAFQFFDKFMFNLDAIYENAPQMLTEAWMDKFVYYRQKEPYHSKILIDSPKFIKNEDLYGRVVYGHGVTTCFRSLKEIHDSHSRVEDYMLVGYTDKAYNPSYHNLDDVHRVYTRNPDPRIRPDTLALVPLINNGGYVDPYSFDYIVDSVVHLFIAVADAVFVDNPSWSGAQIEQKAAELLNCSSFPRKIEDYGECELWVSRFFKRVVLNWNVTETTTTVVPSDKFFDGTTVSAAAVDVVEELDLPVNASVKFEPVLDESTTMAADLEDFLADLGRLF